MKLFDLLKRPLPRVVADIKELTKAAIRGVKGDNPSPKTKQPKM
jgi:hypothetical protein